MSYRPTHCPGCQRELRQIGSSLVCQTCHLQIWLEADEAPYQPFIPGPPELFEERFAAAQMLAESNRQHSFIPGPPDLSAAVAAAREFAEAVQQASAPGRRVESTTCDTAGADGNKP